MSDRKLDTDGVHAIGNTNNHSRIADVVFVHGLGGKSHETWEHGKRDANDYFFWPRELADDLPEFGIWSVGYPAGMFNASAQGMIIELRAENIANRLTSGDRLGLRPLIFITHSMGGLIVKALITEGPARGDDKWRKLVNQVKGVVFCATPHRGSDIVKSTKLCAVLFSGFQDYVLEMEANKARLDTLHDRFLRWRLDQNVPILSYAEGRGLIKRRIFRWLPHLLIVSRTAANTGVPEYPVRGTDETHISIVKPRNKQSEVYEGVTDFIKALRGLEVNNGHSVTDKEPGQTRRNANVQQNIPQPMQNEDLVPEVYKSKIRYKVGLAPEDPKVVLSVTMTYDIENVSDKPAPWRVIYVVPFFCTIRNMKLRFNDENKPCCEVENRGYKGWGGAFSLHPKQKADVWFEIAIEYPPTGYEVFSSFSPAHDLTLEYTIHPMITHNVKPECKRDTLDKVTKERYPVVEIYKIEGSLSSLEGFRLEWTNKR